MVRAQGADEFSLNPQLTAQAFREQFVQTGRIQIPDFLAAGQAERLRSSLLAREDWSLIMNAGEKVYDLPRSAWANLGETQRAQLDKLVIEASRSGFHYRYEAIRVPDEANGRQDTDLLTAFVRFMSSESVLSFLSEIIDCDDLSFADGQATAYSPGHFLTMHTDDVEGKQRRAAYVLGLTPVWRPEWGGLLMFHDKQDNIEEAFTPKMGALRLFSVPVRHSVSYVNPLAPEPRISVTGWLRADQPEG